MSCRCHIQISCGTTWVAGVPQNTHSMQLFRSFAAFTAPLDIRGELRLLADILEGRERYPANFVNGAIYLKLELAAKGKVGLVVMTFCSLPE